MVRAGLPAPPDGHWRSAFDLLSLPGARSGGARGPSSPGCRDLRPRIVAALQTEAHYAGYLQRQAAEIQRFRRSEELTLRPDLDYEAVHGLSAEVCDKLTAARPVSLGSAARIEGMTPAALAALVAYLRKRRVRARRVSRETPRRRGDGNGPRDGTAAPDIRGAATPLEPPDQSDRAGRRTLARRAPHSRFGAARAAVAAAWRHRRPGVRCRLSGPRGGDRNRTTRPSDRIRSAQMRLPARGRTRHRGRRHRPRRPRRSGDPSASRSRDRPRLRAIARAAPSRPACSHRTGLSSF